MNDVDTLGKLFLLLVTLPCHLLIIVDFVNSGLWALNNLVAALFWPPWISPVSSWEIWPYLAILQCTTVTSLLHSHKTYVARNSHLAIFSGFWNEAVSNPREDHASSEHRMWAPRQICVTGLCSVRLPVPENPGFPGKQRCRWEECGLEDLLWKERFRRWFKWRGYFRLANIQTCLRATLFG